MTALGMDVIYAALSRIFTVKLTSDPHVFEVYSTTAGTTLLHMERACSTALEKVDADAVVIVLEKAQTVGTAYLKIEVVMFE